MTDVAADAPEAPTKSSRIGLFLGVFLAIAGGAGGFYAVRSGLLPIPFGGGDPTAPDPHGANSQSGGADTTYVSMDPLIISLNDGGMGMHLKFRADLEVNPAQAHDVEQVMPRIVDVLNGYLRALKLSDLSDPMALTRLRAQMLRRIQIVVGTGQVRDLLIMEFVLN